MNLKGSKCGYVNMVMKKRVSKKREILRLSAKVWASQKKTLLHGVVSMCEECSSEELKDAISSRKIGFHVRYPVLFYVINICGAEL